MECSASTGLQPGTFRREDRPAYHNADCRTHGRLADENGRSLRECRDAQSEVALNPPSSFRCGAENVASQQNADPFRSKRTVSGVE